MIRVYRRPATAIAFAAVYALAASPKRPYVITFQEASYRTNADGSTQGEPLAPGITASLKARQSDGSTVEAGYQSGDIAWRKVASVSQGQRTSIFSRSHTRTSLPLQPAELAELRAGPADAGCRVHPERVSASEILGMDIFHGLQVVKHRFSPPGGTVVLELWEAPALDCEIVVGKTYFRGRNGQMESVTVKSRGQHRIARAGSSAVRYHGPAEMKPSTAGR